MARRNDPQWLDGMYNNRARVPEHVGHFADWNKRSEKARRMETCHLDVAYGDALRETLDVFEPAALLASNGRGAPVLVFIHGGYWRALSKANHSFIAPAFTRAGACVVVPNYTLLPGTSAEPASIRSITMQMVQALAWTWRNIAAYGGDPTRITVVGHSAGGHQAAMLLTCLWSVYARDLPTHVVKNTLSISGLHELETLRRTPYLQDALQLTPEAAAEASPAWLPAPMEGVLYAVTGGDESAEYLRHNRLIQAAWGRRAVPVCEVLPGLNHFTILDTLATPTSRLHAMALQLIHPLT